jgi:hypothetical protein
MVAVRINGEDSTIGNGGPLKIAELVELIKASIDPSHMISSILLNGKELSDEDWANNTANYGTAIIEFQTDTPENFVRIRFGQAADIVNACYTEFRDARKQFQSGDMVSGNKRLVQAVNTARSFFEWYGTLLELVPPDQKKKYDIREQTDEIVETCKKICQQQLYQSWWALGETLQKELEPKLDKLDDFCRKFAVRA